MRPPPRRSVQGSWLPIADGAPYPIRIRAAFIHGGLTLHGGAVEFDFIDGFVPSAGDRFDSFLVASGGIVGLDSVDLRFEGLKSGFDGSIVDVDGSLTLVAGVAAPVDEPLTWGSLFAFVPLVGSLARRRSAP